MREADGCFFDLDEDLLHCDKHGMISKLIEWGNQKIHRDDRAVVMAA